MTELTYSTHSYASYVVCNVSRNCNLRCSCVVVSDQRGWLKNFGDYADDSEARSGPS